jgi:hypothetical protein
MIALLAGSAIYLTALQATLSAPRDAFRACLRDASAKATSEKVGADAFEAYLRNSCSGQLGSLKSAVMAFDMKNGMPRKTAASDADSTVDDYIASPVDNYKFMMSMNAPASQAASPKPPAPTPASVSSQPPKP